MIKTLLDNFLDAKRSAHSKLEALSLARELKYPSLYSLETATGAALHRLIGARGELERELDKFESVDDAIASMN